MLAASAASPAHQRPFAGACRRSRIQGRPLWLGGYFSPVVACDCAFFSAASFFFM